MGRQKRVPVGPGRLGLDGRAPRIIDIDLRLGYPVRVECGPYEQLGFEGGAALCRQAGIQVVDEDRARGEFWLTQLVPLDGRLAITVVLTLTRPGGKVERMRRVFVAQGGE